MDNIVILMGMQSTGSQDPRQKSRRALSIHMSVARREMVVNVHWSERFRDWSPQPDWTVRLSFSSILQKTKKKLSHVVVLVGVLFVTLHIVPVNERLYSFLQVSRLEWKKGGEVIMQRFLCISKLWRHTEKCWFEEVVEFPQINLLYKKLFRM